jgi:hypothetical protein
MYVCLLLNHIAKSALGWKTHMQALTGQNPDISKFLHFSLYEPVYYHSFSDTYLSASNEVGGLVLLPMLVMNSHTSSLLRNNRLFTGQLSGLLWILLNGTSVFLHLEGRRYPITLSFKFLFDLKWICLSLQQKMVLYWMVIQVSNNAWLPLKLRAVLDNEDSMTKDPRYMKFICEVPNSKVDKMFTYIKILDHIEKDKDDIEN